MAGVDVQLLADEVELTTVPADENGLWSATVTLAPGTHQLVARQSSGGSTLSSTATPVTVTAPVDPGPETPGGGQPQTPDGTGTPGGSHARARSRPARHRPAAAPRPGRRPRRAPAPDAGPARPGAPRVTRFTVTRQCVRPARGGRVALGLRLRLARPATSAVVRVDRAVGSGALARCPAPNPHRRGFADGSFAPVARLTRPLSGRPADALSARLRLSLKLPPGLYRVRVRARGADGRLSRPVRRFIRVLG